MKIKTALLVLTGLLVFTCGAFALDYTLTCNPDPIQCGEPTTLTLTVDELPSECKYYLSCIYLDYDDTPYYLFSPAATRSPYKSYQESNTFEFTFYASGEYRIIFYIMYRNSSDTPYSILRKDFYITIDDPDYPTIESIADGIVADCKAKTSDEYELALALHDWIIEHTEYDNSLMYCHPEGVFARGQSICDSYQRAYAMLLNRAGIANGRAEAVVSGGGHTWNLVRINGKWYHIDPTWDDGKDAHLYFGVSDEYIMLSQGHMPYTPHEDALCVSLDDSYYVRSGDVTKWSDRYVETVQAQLDAGAERFTFESGKIEDSTYNDELRRGLCACYLSKQSWSTPYGTAQVTLTYSIEDQTFTGEAVYSGSLTLPRSLSAVEAGAFEGVPADTIIVPAALTDEASLANLPSNAVWVVEAGSAAEAYAQSHGIQTRQ